MPGSYSAQALIFHGIGEQGTTVVVQNIEVTDADLNGVRIEVMPASLVRGRVRIESGEIDFSQLSVWLVRNDEPASSSPSVAKVKQNGSFEIENVAGGSYRASVNATSSNLVNYFTKAVNLDGKDVLDSGFTVRGATYVLDVVYSGNGATIEGNVVADTNQPVAYSKVVCGATGEHGNNFYTDETDERGHFQIRGLAPGEYTVLAAVELELGYRESEFLKSHKGEGQSVRVGEGERKSVTVKLIPSTDEEP